MAKKIVHIGDVECGGRNLFLIAGPCVIEEEVLMFRIAERLKQISEKLKLPLIFKSSFQKDNRSNLQFYSGPGITRGLEILWKIKEKLGLPVTSDIHYPRQVKEAASVLDLIQIPAYLCMQTELVVAAAASGRPINLKHGQFLAPQNMVHPVKKIEASGHNQILLTERGYTFGYNDLIVDPRSFYLLGRSGYPVIFDITHSTRRYGIPSSDPHGGSREFLPVLARAGVAAGVDGLFIEVHPDPSEALCDAASQLKLDDLEAFLVPLLEIHEVVSKEKR